MQDLHIREYISKLWKYLLDGADRTVPTPQHELDHTDVSNVWTLPLLEKLSNRRTAVDSWPTRYKQARLHV